MLNSETLGTTHVWVRTDLIEAIQRHGQLPKGWRSRKRLRDERDAWGWCRARVTSNENRQSIAPNNSNNGNSVTSPFGQVQLRRTQKSPQWKSMEVQPRTLSVTLTVEDPEFAPPELDRVSVSFVYNTGDNSKVCPSNTWWQQNETPPEDLTSLEQLHEPAVVFCLQTRYQNDYIYTYTGKVLLALNPFRAIESLYGSDVMAQYWQNDYSGQRPPPHIFAIAEDAYRSMVNAMQMADRSPNQSILVSGESGAGKTVTTKIIMRYLATLSEQSSHHSRGNAGIESQVLLSNPILESLGNARTVRNDNSSRFGKFMEILFEPSGCLTSARIETYLLEKVRLISQAPGERNYHIFYELLAGLSQNERRCFQIGNKSARDFRMTSNSGTYDRRDGVSDRAKFQELKHALTTVGFTATDQRDLFSTACALLHASNLTFLEIDAHEDSSALDRRNASFRAAVELLGVDENTLDNALCRHEIQARHERLYKTLDTARAQKALEALIKATYGALFNHIVRRMNTFIAGMPANRGAFIGVLDIFGFESFEVNSFEQLCINYCNEALQQQFNRFVFKLEQQEYQKEGIEWSFISFPDNQDILDLIEKKHGGILSILDEQSRLPRCTDSTFAQAIYEKCDGNVRFEASKSQQAVCTFSIDHYAGLVEYDTMNFLEKNKDELPKETTELLCTSSYPLLATLGKDLESEPGEQSSSSVPKGRSKILQRSSSSILRESVGTQFRAQLLALRSRIESTNPHYVRCLKPNDDLVPQNFNPLVIADQLRCAGVLEAIRVSRIGFPHRFAHDRFVQRYRLLANRQVGKAKRRAGIDCDELVQTLTPQVQSLVEEEGKEQSNDVFYGIQMGKTKVFLRRRAFEALEYLRGRKLENAAAKIQAMARMHIARIDFEVARYAAVIIQRFVRQIEAYRSAQVLRVDNAVLRMQRAWRCYSARRILVAGLTIAWWGQSAYRGALARQYCAYVFLDNKVCMIQRAWKRHLSSHVFRKVRRAVIFVQNSHRRRMARKELIRLRQEARDVKAIAAERDKLRLESLKLKEELEKAKKAVETPKLVYKTVQAYPTRSEEVERLKAELQRLRTELSAAKTRQSSPRNQAAEIALLKEELSRREEQLDFLRQEVSSLRSHGDSFSIQSFVIEINPKDRMSPLPLSSSRSPMQSPDVSLLDEVGDSDNQAVFTSPLPVKDTPALDVLSPNGANGTELRYLFSAIRQRNTKLFAQILKQSSEPCALVNEIDNHGRSAIHVATLCNVLEIVEILLQQGAAANVQDVDGETPLHLAGNASMIELLLKKGNANPNIPNLDGICSLHLAVQRRDIQSVKTLLLFNADMNSADNIRWFTSLHLIALSPRSDVILSDEADLGSRIAQLLTSKYGNHSPDLDYQDREGNAPLHYAVQLESEDACGVIAAFLGQGANPNIRNERNQSPLHLLCHNEELRALNVFHEILHSMLFHGADPNQQSLTGCTPLHLSLYHKDIDSAVQLVARGAELHLLWKKVRVRVFCEPCFSLSSQVVFVTMKPKRWNCFWKDTGEQEVLALDMLQEDHSLHRILSAINRPLKWAPTRSWCMHCKGVLGTHTRALHCRHCSRLVCGDCSTCCLPSEYFPKSFGVNEPSWVCSSCENILRGRKEDLSNETQPASSSYGDDDDQFSC